MGSEASSVVCAVDSMSNVVRWLDSCLTFVMCLRTGVGVMSVMVTTSLSSIESAVENGLEAEVVGGVGAEVEARWQRCSSADMAAMPPPTMTKCMADAFVERKVNGTDAGRARRGGCTAAVEVAKRRCMVCVWQYGR